MQSAGVGTFQSLTLKTGVARTLPFQNQGIRPVCYQELLESLELSGDQAMMKRKRMALDMTVESINHVVHRPTNRKEEKNEGIVASQARKVSRAR